MKNFLKCLENGKLKDISNFYFSYFDANNIGCLFEYLEEYRDLYVDRDSYEFDEEYYDLHIDRDYPGFKELFELISLLDDKIKTEHPTIIFDSDSDSD